MVIFRGKRGVKVPFPEILESSKKFLNSIFVDAESVQKNIEIF